MDKRIVHCVEECNGCEYDGRCDNQFQSAMFAPCCDIQYQSATFVPPDGKHIKLDREKLISIVKTIAKSFDLDVFIFVSKVETVTGECDVHIGIYGGVLPGNYRDCRIYWTGFDSTSDSMEYAAWYRCLKKLIENF